MSIFGEITAIRIKPPESRSVHPQRRHHPSRHQAGECDVRQVKSKLIQNEKIKRIIEDLI